jgi:enoyl-CoA hydratase
MKDGNSSHAPVRTWQEAGVGFIELSKPERFNCLSADMFRRIERALDEFEAEPSVRAIVVSAQGKNFCTGAELDEVEAVSRSKQDLREFLKFGNGVLCQLEASPLPVVAAVQGLCLAGGLELVMACDVVFAADNARFGDQHAAFGLIPGWGNSQRLPRAVGLQRALDLMLSARWIDAKTALSWGLISYAVAPEALRDEAVTYAKLLAIRSRTGIAAMKSLARRALDVPLEAGLLQETEAASNILMDADAKEGLSAFKEKRLPDFVRQPR